MVAEVLRASDRAKTAQAFAMSDFSATINQLMVGAMEGFDAQTKWNDPNTDTTTRVQQKLDAVKGVMIDNIGMRHSLVTFADKIIDRGEKLDIIVDKTDALADTADVSLRLGVERSCSARMRRS